MDEPVTAQGAPAVAAIRPVPTDDEAVAIVAAVETGWPRAVVVEAPTEPTRWRFSGRWWSKPLPMRRNRP